MQNPYEPPKEYEQERLPKYEEPIVDWPSLIIILGTLSKYKYNKHLVKQLE